MPDIVRLVAFDSNATDSEVIEKLCRTWSGMTVVQTKLPEQHQGTVRCLARILERIREDQQKTGDHHELLVSSALKATETGAETQSDFKQFAVWHENTSTSQISQRFLPRTLHPPSAQYGMQRLVAWSFYLSLALSHHFFGQNSYDSELGVISVSSQDWLLLRSAKGELETVTPPE